MFGLYFVMTLAILAMGRRHIASNRRMAATAGAILLLMPLGQATRKDRLTYPFVYWGMYSTHYPPRTYYEFTVRSASGRDFDYPFSNVAPLAPGPLRGFSTLAPISMRLANRLRECRCASGDFMLDSIVIALARIHERRHRERIVQFEIHENAIALRRTELRTRRLLYTWNASPTS